MERLKPVLQSLALRYDQPQHINMLEVAEETPGEGNEGDARVAAIVLPHGCSDMEYKYRQVCVLYSHSHSYSHQSSRVLR